MSILTRINNTPVYTNIDEALSWAEYNGLSGYHIHKHMGVTGYMGGKTHDAFRKTSELPVKVKSKPGYSPKVGSRIISIVKGKQFTTEVTAKTIYDRKGFPILDEESSVGVSVPGQLNPVQRLITPNVPRQTSSTPLVNNTPPVNNTPASRSSRSSGGGY